jgi:hypothetical protein
MSNTRLSQSINFIMTSTLFRCSNLIFHELSYGNLEELSNVDFLLLLKRIEKN